MSDQVLLVPAAISFVLAALALRLLLWPALRIALDRPNRRSLHSEPVPRTGGVALIAAAMAGSAWTPLTPPTAVVAALLLLLAVSFLDDVRSVSIALRLASHMLAGCAAASLLWPEQGYVVMLTAALATAWMINAYNFMDGSDGMAGGMALIGFAAYGWLGAGAGDAGVAALGFSISSAAAAFLLFNFHPARIFLGDVGAVPLGFLAAVIGIYGWSRDLWSPLVPILIFSPFIADATVTLARRTLARSRVWEAHNDHYYQRLIRLGWGHRATALAAWATMLVAATLATAVSGASSAVQLSWAAAWYVLLGTLLLAVEIRWRRRAAG